MIKGKTAADYHQPAPKQPVGDPDYPRYVDHPNGEKFLVKTADEHAALMRPTITVTTLADALADPKDNPGVSVKEVYPEKEEHDAAVADAPSEQ